MTRETREGRRDYLGQSSETHGVGGGEKKGGKSLDEGSGGEKSVGIFGLREGEEFEAQRHIRGRGDRQGVLGWRGVGESTRYSEYFRRAPVRFSSLNKGRERILWRSERTSVRFSSCG